MPLTQKDAQQLIGRRHPEWSEHQRRWRWLQDSLEGGNRYRHADYTLDPTMPQPPGYVPWYNYGYDPTTSEPYPISFGQIVDRNLVPHLSETGTDGRPVYVLRLNRTPVPTNVERAVESHLSRIYSREVARGGPAALASWWEDVDGKGTPVDWWMQETVAPLLMVLGQLDLVFDRPRAPGGAAVRTKADERALGLDRVVANIVLPENLTWWQKDARGRYSEVVVFERCGEGVRYRHWTPTASDLYDAEGKFLPEGSHEHKLGFVPVVRVFDRKKVRCENVGRSRYESIAELQKAIYNARSELILGDVEQSSAQLQGPEDYLQKGADIPVGPGNILPMKGDDKGGYVGWSYVDPPKGAQQEVRTHILDFQDEADRDGALLKPAGMTSGSTVGQSGISKIADSQDGNALLARIAETLARCESVAARMVLDVLGAKDAAAVDVVYPKQFDLFTLDDLSAALDDLQRIASLAGALPETEGELMKRLVSVALPGLPDDRLQALHGEIDRFMKGAAAAKAAPPEDDDGWMLGDYEQEGPVPTSIVNTESSVLLSPEPS